MTKSITQDSNVQPTDEILVQDVKPAMTEHSPSPIEAEPSDDITERGAFAPDTRDSHEHPSGEDSTLLLDSSSAREQPVESTHSDPSPVTPEDIIPSTDDAPHPSTDQNATEAVTKHGGLVSDMPNETGTTLEAAVPPVVTTADPEPRADEEGSHDHPVSGPEMAASLPNKEPLAEPSVEDERPTVPAQDIIPSAAPLIPSSTDGDAVNTDGPLGDPPLDSKPQALLTSTPQNEDGSETPKAPATSLPTPPRIVLDDSDKGVIETNAESEPLQEREAHLNGFSSTANDFVFPNPLGDHSPAQSKGTLESADFPAESQSPHVTSDSISNPSGAEFDASPYTVDTALTETDNHGTSEGDHVPKRETLGVLEETRSRNHSTTSSKSPQVPGAWASPTKAVGASLDVHAEGQFSSSRRKSRHLKDVIEKKKNAWKCIVM
ncbi:hypothetical protein BOTBODRAFT_277885 [Botryobasidium botryosum FD-172 SS1]|uniref:Uncharacterized protein n=1 Tax=Botryobasidium botryosum (strain FD-172 SS1) TaxID=930990 RepID=A0A067MVR7_BOTB1|nr:hypothetical protein BOTBODRAFT_277885 [Botryobasidium botryosum FD-172 SS1]